MAITTAEGALALLLKLEKSLNAQAEDAEKWRKYYDGDQKLTFSSPQWREWFGAQYDGFADNWCAPVADATSERQSLVGFRPYEQAKADKDITRVMKVNNADEDFSLAAAEAQYARRAFGSVWGNREDPATPIVEFESPFQVFVAYAPGSRKRRAAAIKRWNDDDGNVYATLYTPEHIWKFKRAGSNSSLILPPGFGGQYAPREVDGEPWPLPNPMKIVPIAELPNRTTLSSEPLSSIKGVAAMQDAVNLIWAHLFTASDFAALPQRVILGAELPKLPVLDNEGQPTGAFKAVDLPEANVRRILNFDGPNAKIQEWSSANLDQFLSVIKVAVAHITDQTRTPAYYFSSGATISNISGDTVKALDAGLVKKVNRVNRAMSSGLKDMATMICLAQGDTKKAAAMAAGEVLFADAEIRSDAQLADAMSKYREIGFPFEWVAKQKIDDPDELAEVVAAYQNENTDQALERLARGLDAGANQFVPAE